MYLLMGIVWFQDVSFVVDMEDGQMLGSNFDVIVKVQNHSRDKRTVKMRVTLKTVYYTGVQRAIVKSKKFQLELDSVACERHKMLGLQSSPVAAVTVVLFACSDGCGAAHHV